MPSTRRTLDRFEEWCRKPVPAVVADAEAAEVAGAAGAAVADIAAEAAACLGELAACARPDSFPDTLIKMQVILAGSDNIDPANAFVMGHSLVPVAIFDIYWQYSQAGQTIFQYHSEIRA
jgi:hypothetical protein